MKRDTAVPRQPARRRQAIRVDDSHAATGSASDISDQPVAGDNPLIVAHGVYSRRQLMKRLGVASETLTKWEELGPLQCMPGTRAGYYIGSDVIALMQKYRDSK